MAAPMMKNERDVKKRVKEIFKRHDVWYFMPAMSGYGRPGIPDFVACIKGEFVGVETKFGPNRMTKNQTFEAAQIDSAGGWHWLVNEKNVEDFGRWVQTRS